MISMAMTSSLSKRPHWRQILLAAMAGLACALVVGKPLAMARISEVLAPLCITSGAASSPLDKVEVIASPMLWRTRPANV
jgi:hypothetical protein